MRRWAFLLRPGWLALFVVVIAFAYLCFTVLAPWQLGKNTKTSRENAQISHSLTADPVPVTTLLPQQDSSAPDEQWRRVTATGHYLPDAQVLARLRVVEGDPAFEVLVPFAVDGGPTVLVDRGYVRPEQGSRVPPIAPPPNGTVTITARLRDSEPVPEGKDPFRQDGAQQVYAINTAQISAVTGVPLAGSYLQLVEDQPGGLGVIGLPHLDAGPFLSYGIQWIAFGILAPIGLGYFVVSEIRQRRREKASQAERRSPPRRNSPTATAGGAERHGRQHAPPACTARDSRTARRRSVTSGTRPSPRVGRISSWWAYCVGPPSRTPSAPANAASTTPALGLGWRAASRRQARTAPAAEPPTTGAHTATSTAVTRAATKLAASSNRAAAQPNRA